MIQMRTKEMKINKETGSILNTKKKWKSIHKDYTKLYIKSITEQYHSF